ncbi:alpha/beta hydrolase [Rhodococcus sp. NPDC058505]|uniref:alpha/beta hydrolase n=1 Tax=unclassified Rhodococcus (in: high G+C Gram-positive bacteria) TaxID=192944 RepID=UPI003649250B
MTTQPSSVHSPTPRAPRRRRGAGRQPTVVTVEPQFVPGAGLRSRLLAGTVRLGVKPVLDVWGRYPSPLWPAGLLDRSASMLRPTRAAGRHRVRLDDCAAEWWPRRGGRPGRDQPDAGTAILYLHGGGFLACGLNTHRALALRIASAADAAVLSVDYRMLPRHPIAAATADGVAGYRWLLEHGYPADRIVIAGDSAGGFLTFTTALALTGRGLPQPAALVALSPLTDLDPSAKLASADADGCPLIPRSVLVTLARIAERADGDTPTVSPVDGHLAGLPPVLIQVGSTEMLYPDAELMAHRLGAAGVPVTLEVWDRQVHVFQAAAGLLPEAARAVGRIGAFVRAATAETVPAAARTGVGPGR